MIRGLHKTTMLKNLFNSKNLEFIMEAHNGISAKIVEETGFKAIWASGLTMSASMGLRDNNEASWCQVLNNLEYMSDATNIPILVDGDTGYGDFNNARRYVRKLEERGIAGVCFEDKLFPKTNSFIDGEYQELADVAEFSSKILACKEYQRYPDFQVVARLESFITGAGLESALSRANAYAESGADAILVHSKINEPTEILDFSKYWTSNVPLIIVPTMYWQTPMDTFREANISSIIWANHNMRSIIKTMKETSQTIFEDESLVNIENKIEPVEEIFRLQDANTLKSDDKKYNGGFTYTKKNAEHYNIPNKKNYTITLPCGVQKRKYHTNLNETTRDFLSCKDFYKKLRSHNIDFYTGVPDSLLKDYLSYIKNKNNYIVPNEGLAVSFATGYHLATKKIPCVYLQNSGLGNIINPLISLIDEKVYNIPMLFLIGWRGEPYKKDEPQHQRQGEITENLLKSLDIKYSILPDNMGYASFKIDELITYMKKTNKPTAFLIKRQTFKNEMYKTNEIKNEIENTKLKRYDVLNLLTLYLKDYKFISTTGFTSRELYSIRKEKNQSHSQDFYVVGSMGHCSTIANSYSLFSKKKTVCIDGDGSLLMHMGSLSCIGNHNNKNLIHILLNNNSHESVGGQTTSSFKTNFHKVAKECNYKHIFLVDQIYQLKDILDNKEIIEDGPIFIEIKIDSGTNKILQRPKEEFKQLKEDFINNYN